MENNLPLHTRFGMKWNPFDGETPPESLWSHDEIDDFILRVQQISRIGGFALITGTPGRGKSAVLRMLKHQLSSGHKIQVSELCRPQSRLRDFYYELGALYGVEMTGANRFGTFQRLREDWQSKIQSRSHRPLLIIDEAQELHPEVLLELRLLASVDLDSRSILTVVLAGDTRLSAMLERPEHQPVRSRIRASLQLRDWDAEQLASFLRHQIKEAGRPDLITPEVIQALCEQSLGSPRILSSLCAECLLQAKQAGRSAIDMDTWLDLGKKFRSKPSKTPAR